MTQRHAEIVGAGFAGLTAACALAQRGWSVRVHERADALRTTGAGIYIYENGLRVLEAVGAYDAAVKGAPFAHTREVRDDQNRTISVHRWGGSRVYSIVRQTVINALADAARRAGVEIVLHNMPRGDPQRGEHGTGCLPGREAAFREYLERALEYARAAGCRRLHCQAGVAPAGADPAELHRTFVQNLKWAAGRLKREGIDLLIEPLSAGTVKNYFLSGSAQAVAVLGVGQRHADLDALEPRQRDDVPRVRSLDVDALESEIGEELEHLRLLGRLPFRHHAPLAVRQQRDRLAHRHAAALDAPDRDPSHVG